MHRVRPIITALMLLLILPWGAYAGGFSLARTVTVDADVWLELPVKTCRTAALPGSPCAPDLALPAGTGTQSAARHERHVATPSRRLARDLARAPLKGPPRAV